MRALISGALAAVILLIPACVELTGQRITWFYDTPNDTLHFLIHYDGIHEAETGSSWLRRTQRKGAEQIPEFVENGDVMLFGWPFHFDRNRIRDAGGESDDPLVIGAAELIPAVETQTLGFYREPDGRIGAAQRVSIPQATEFLRRVNGLISLALLAERQRRPSRSEMPRTMERVWDAARTDHEWIAINGHSLRVSSPVHPGEWSQAKATFVRDVFDEVIEGIEDADEDGESLARTLSEMLGSAPISYIDEGDRITFVLGRPDQPSTLRLDIRDVYEPSLEEIVTEALDVDLDEALSQSLLYPGTGLPQHLAPLLEWGPPEERVRALLSRASDAPAGLRSAIAEHLARWGEQWNREHGVPLAPSELQPTGFMTAWETWYDQVVSPGR